LLKPRPHFIPSLIAAAMLLVALVPWPYGYYMLLRWVTCAAAIYVAYKAYVWGTAWAAWAFGFVAALFNPLLPIHLDRELWRPIDVTAAAAFVLAVFLLRQPPIPEESKDDGVQHEDQTPGHYDATRIGHGIRDERGQGTGE